LAGSVQGVVVHRQVGLGPFAEHTEPLESLALQADVFLGILSAFAPEVDRAHRGLFCPEQLINADLNREPMAVPSR